MADEYPGLMEDEEERKVPYPPVGPSLQPPFETESTRVDESLVEPPAPNYLGGPTLENRLSLLRPQPRWEDYAPAQPHGFGKVGHFLASLNPHTNAFFNERPERQAEQRFNLANKEWGGDVERQETLNKDTLARAREAREARAVEQRPELLETQGAMKERLEREREKAAQRRTETQGQTARDVAATRAQNARQPIRVMGDKTYERQADGSWKEIGPAPPRTEPGNYLPVNDEAGATTGWIDPKSHKFVGLDEIQGEGAPRAVIPPKPSGTGKARQEQAAAITRAADGLSQTITTHKDKVGNVEAILKAAFLNTPLADADLAGIATELASFAALQPAMHGFRGQDALREFKKLIGGVPKDADALLASIAAIKKTAGYVNPKVSENKATPKTGFKEF